MLSGVSRGLCMDYMPLTEVWARNGLASVLVASLEAGGFRPVTEWDPRGPMHFYGWPLGSSAPVTVWIPAEELEQARAYLSAPAELPWEADGPVVNFWGGVQAWRRGIYGVWLATNAVELLSAAGGAVIALVTLVGIGGSP
jgi:hypothetical protein